ncbi:MAG: threonine--tRNA ligase [Tissierellia bacterium]|nr:threonine--tRNA ligase [Tissierellia bacterium]
MIKITLPDGSVMEKEKGISLAQLCQSISMGLYREAMGAVVDGEVKGFHEILDHDCEVKFVKFDDPEGKEIFWHTSSHLMAYAIQRLFDDVLFAIGPAIDNGFYYDLDSEHHFSEEDFEAIEKEMKKIVKEGHKMEKIEISRKEALERFREQGDIYKVELIESFDPEDKISLYQLGDFVDLCRGPHLMDVSKIKAVKLLSVAGAYWRGDENNKMLQRIYGITFPKQKMLEEYLNMLEEAKKRDHRKLGRELDLFSIHEEGPGFPFFHPKGMIIKNQLEGFLRKTLADRGYGEIKTPLILNEDLWHRSGHWDNYKENMYYTKIDREDYAIKPMNCPGSIIVYNSRPHSYRELPIRMAELGQVHRHELSGALHGLLRVRTFVQDDAHVFCLPEQIEDEITDIIDLCDYIYSVFGFRYTVELSTKPENAMGSDEDWERATEALRKALERNHLDYRINEGDGAFYGPKIDFHLLDAIGRPWQCGTIQLDFQMPERFEMTYIDSNGEKKRPVMIHRAILGSEERFMGILIEHFAGKFPAWLSPVQVDILPISDKFNPYGEEIEKKLKDAGFRVHLDGRSEKIGFKIRESQLRKTNYALILGEKEMNSGEVSVRVRDEGDIGAMKLEDFIQKLDKEIKRKEIK